jgi:hypothetical protein
MRFFNFKTNVVKRIMKGITPHERAYFINNENNLRLCNRIGGKLSYITIPFFDNKALCLAAGILKDCGIVDGFTCNANKVELFQYSMRVHKDAKGRCTEVYLKKPIAWQDLKLTQQDVRAFAAHFAFKSGSEMIRLPEETTPVIPLRPRHNNSNNPTKRTA